MSDVQCAMRVERLVRMLGVVCALLLAGARDAQRVGEEVESLYTNGPAGGGGATKSMREVIAVASAFVPREAVRTSVEWMES